MTIDLYYDEISFPCRAVLLTAKALGIELNLKKVDLMKGEHLQPEYIKINVQHTVPYLVDNGLALSESRAIMTYLVSQYGKDDSLYPKDPKKRAKVDQRLYFEATTLTQRYFDYYKPVLFFGLPADPAKLELLKASYGNLNSFLEQSEYAAGDKLTVADLSLVASVSTAEASGFDLSPYPNVTKWCERVKKTAPGYEELNGKHLVTMKQMIQQMAEKRKESK